MNLDLKSGFGAIVILALFSSICDVGAQELPKNFTGTWTYVDSTGGFTGWGDLDYDVERISILPGGAYGEFRGGLKVSSTPFSASREISIYTGRNEWTIQMEGRIPMSLKFANGRLVLSQEVHDGFQYHYVPGAPPSPVVAITVDTVEFSWESRSGTVDQMEWNDDLITWHPLPGKTYVGTTESGRFRFSITILGEKRFFRVRRTLSSEE